MRNAPRPIFITLKKHRVGRNTPLSVPDSGEVSNITFNNFQISQLNSLCFDNAEGIIIDGMKHHKIEHICFNHIEYEAVGGYEDYQEREVPNEDEVRGEYHLYEGALPASVAFVRNSHDVIFNNFRVSYCKPDCRKPLVAVDSTQIGNL